MATKSHEPPSRDLEAHLRVPLNEVIVRLRELGVPLQRLIQGRHRVDVISQGFWSPSNGEPS